jgi:hypothetical protein
MPLTSVVAGVATLVIALQDPDGLVADDYYKSGLAINRVLKRHDEAERLTLSGSGRIDLATLDVAVDLAGHAPPTDALRLVLSHATRADRDQQVDLRAIADSGRFAGQLSGPLSRGAWRAALEPLDGAWRIVGRVLVSGDRDAVDLDLRP